VGAWLRDSAGGRRLLAYFLSRGRFVRTSGLGGFLLLWSIARLRRWRPRTLRWREEQERIEAWLGSAINAARQDYDLGVEIIRLQRLVKGYGATQERGLRNFATILTTAGQLQSYPDAAQVIARLHEAALADDEGMELQKALATLPLNSPRNLEMQVDPDTHSIPEKSPT